MPRFNASKVRAAVNRYNSAVRQHNARVRRAIAEHNRRVRRFNTQVSELRRQLALLQRHSRVRTYAQLRLELQTVVTHQERTLVVRDEEWRQLDDHDQAWLQEAAQDDGVEVLLVDSEGDEV